MVEVGRRRVGIGGEGGGEKGAGGAGREVDGVVRRALWWLCCG